LAVVAEPLTLTLFGPPWFRVSEIVQVMCAVAMLQCLTNPTGWIYTSQARTDLMFWWGVFGAGTLVAAIVTGIIVGDIRSVALCYLAANLVLLYPAITIPGRLVGIGFRDVGVSVAGNLAAALLMGVAVLAVRRLLVNLPVGLELGLAILSGVVAYASLAFVMRLAALRELSAVFSNPN
ncbi:MAG: hypothetical protein AAFQ82_28210, partial [Myxococcota bacterium]